MPKMPCLDCGIPNPKSRCDACYEKREAAKPPRVRLSAHKRGYDKAWYQVQRKILQRDAYTCYRCQKKLVGSDATVDHIIPLSKDRSLRLVESNLAACCRSCNSSKQNK
jgi:5-methylcytosine-specific restriction endonuclease McrA